MDVAKYLITVGFIGGILTDKISIISGIILVAVINIVFWVAFFTLPPERKE